MIPDEDPVSLLLGPVSGTPGEEEIEDAALLLGTLCVSVAVSGPVDGPDPAPFCGVTVKLKDCPERGSGGWKTK